MYGNTKILQNNIHYAVGNLQKEINELKKELCELKDLIRTAYEKTSQAI